MKNGTSKLADADPELLRNDFKDFIDSHLTLEYPGFYGDGKTAEFILQEILMMFEKE